MGEHQIEINLAASLSQYTVDTAKIECLVKRALDRLRLPLIEIGVGFVNGDEIRKLNREFRNKDKITDVLSFPQVDFEAPVLVGEPPAVEGGFAMPCQALGDIVISLEAAHGNAMDIGQGLDREVCFLLMHGILHLCGHDHQLPDEEASMIAQQNLLIESLDEEGGPPLWLKCVEVV